MATPNNLNPDERNVIDAMRSIQTEGDRWTLGEALHAVIPAGKHGFEALVDKAASQGVKTGLSLTSLRLYRDTAKRWPADMRVDGISFSAHREAMVLEESHGMAEAVRTLNDLKAAADAAGKPLTVKAVREAIAVKQDRVIPGAAAAAAAAAAGQPTGKIADVIADLKAGGTQVIAGIPNNMPEADLDLIQAGLDKVMARVTQLKVKHTRAARNAAKTAQTPKAPATPVAQPAATTPAAPAAKSATPAKGDLRRRGR